MLDKVGGSMLFRRKVEAIDPPVLSNGHRVPYGPFSFRASLSPHGAAYTVLASTNLTNWMPVATGTTRDPSIEFLDSDASKFSHRFYRMLAGGVPSLGVIGFVSITLAPGFSLIANPLASRNNSVGEMFKGWPDGTSLNKFDTRVFKLSENALMNKRWTRADEKLSPGEGAIFFNPGTDYKSHSFVGEVLQGNLASPVPSGFSLRSSLVPQPGNLVDDLRFPIADGDIIHLFDRDRQKYVLHPFENGKWKSGPPVISVGEAFWVAKTGPGNWSRQMVLK
jgi:hypothetical protein